MPLLSVVGKRTWSQRSFVWLIYANLVFFGASMAIPFMITLTGSVTNSFDYERFSIVPRSLWSSSDRFMKGLPMFSVAADILPERPAGWTTWRAIGLDTERVDEVGRRYLDADEAEFSRWRTQAADYSDFTLGYSLDDTRAIFTNEFAAETMLRHYEEQARRADPEARLRGKALERAALERLSARWGVPIENYIAIRFDSERRSPMWQQSWFPRGNAKWEDYTVLRHHLLHGAATPGVQSAWRSFLRAEGLSSAEASRLSPLPFDASVEERELWRRFAREHAPLAPTQPYSLRRAWIDYLTGDRTRERLALGAGERFDIGRYNRLAGTGYASLEQTPFPLPAEGFDGLRELWRSFVETQYPLRHVRLVVTPELRARYEAFLERTYERVPSLNQILGTSHREWADFPLAESLPPARADGSVGVREVWAAFVRTLGAEDRVIGSADAAYQAFLRERHGNLDTLNAAYGWNLAHWEEARMPLDKAYAVTYREHRGSFAIAPAWFNYSTIGRFLVDQGNSIPVTLWLIILSIFASLTVNPIAGYALSRFRLRAKDKIILFCLATSAFPAMVSAIPGYLLMRDLGMLNTFFALVLPGAASGMGIFILKGFFDSLPQELYEAATIDGAREWQIFLFVTMPMVTPILAINALGAFMAAYDGWAWALIICQDPEMWTISVWLYQASIWWSNSAWITTAGFVVASIPTLIVFLFCQKIIMRGIIVPSMK